MKFSHHLLQGVCLLAFSISAYSNHIDLSKYKMNAEQIKSEWLVKMSRRLPPSAAAISLFNKNKANEIQEIRTLQAKLSGLHLKQKIIADVNASFTHLTTDQYGDDISGSALPVSMVNLQGLQAFDAISYLESVRASTEMTVNILQSMHNLAAEAMNGTYSSNELADMDMTYRIYKDMLTVVQEVSLFNGNKTLGRGDIVLRIGNNNANTATLTLHMPVYNAVALSLDQTDLASSADATIAVKNINSALTVATKAHMIAHAPYIDDMEALILSDLRKLSEEFILLGELDQITSLAMMANLFGTTDEMELAFDYVRSTLMRAQTYVSLDGVKMLGGGNITISIGEPVTRDNTLVVSLPITDVNSLGIDSLNVANLDTSWLAHNRLTTIMHDFVYGATCS